MQEEGHQQPWAACYICQLSSVPGKFLPQKAKALGVTPGPFFGQLKAGNAVEGKDRMIEPHEVYSQLCMPACFSWFAVLYHTHANAAYATTWTIRGSRPLAHLKVT